MLSLTASILRTGIFSETCPDRKHDGRQRPAADGDRRPLRLETLDHALMIAQTVADACESAGAVMSSRPATTRPTAPRWVAVAASASGSGLRMLEEVRNRIGCPVLTDVHDIDQARMAGAVVDVLQILAVFPSRQTDLLLAHAGRTSAAVNIKKGQFLALGHAERR